MAFFFVVFVYAFLHHLQRPWWLKKVRFFFLFLSTFSTLFLPTLYHFHNRTRNSNNTALSDRLPLTVSRNERGDCEKGARMRS